MFNDPSQTMVSTLNCCEVRLASLALVALAFSPKASAVASCGGRQMSPSSTVRTTYCEVSSGLDLGMKPLASNSRERCITAAPLCTEITTTGTYGYCLRSNTKPEKP